MVRVVLDNRVRVPLAEVSEGVAADIRAAFTHENPLFGKRGRAGEEPPFIRTWEHDAEGRLSLPRGGCERVLEILEERAGLSEGLFGYSVEDETTWENPEPDFPDHLVEQRDYQREAIEAAEELRSGVLRAPTGSGKTTSLLGLLARLKRRSLVMVWTSALVKQWQDRAVLELGMAPEDVGIIRGSRTRIRPLTIGMQQSIVERFAAGDEELATTFDVVACDELQRFAAPTLFASVDPFRARYRIGTSADETRKDEKEFLIYDLFGPIAHAVEERALIESGAVVEVEVAAVPTAFHAPWYRYRQDFNRLLAQMTEDPARNALIMKLALRAVRGGHQVIVFTHRVEHAREIDRRLVEAGVPSGLLLGGADNELEFTRTSDGIKRGALRAAVGTYQAIAQGLDLPSVSRGICATPIANNRQQLGQVCGRFARPSTGKDCGRLAVLWDRHVYGRRSIENLVRWRRVVRVWDGKGWVPGGDFLRSMTKRSDAA